jgi:hypothetical protein
MACATLASCDGERSHHRDVAHPLGELTLDRWKIVGAHDRADPKPGRSAIRSHTGRGEHDHQHDSDHSSSTGMAISFPRLLSPEHDDGDQLQARRKSTSSCFASSRIES